MQNINSRSSLRQAILSLEERQAAQGALLKAEIHDAYERIQPINIVKNAFREIFVSSSLKDDVLNTSMSWTIGFLSKQFFENISDSPFKKLLGNILMFGVTNVVERNPEFFKSLGANIFSIFKKYIDKKV